MATQIFIAHSGQLLQAGNRQFASIDELKNWIAQRSSIPAPFIVVLTSRGRSLKTQSHLSETEFHVYDIRSTQTKTPGSSASAYQIPTPRAYVPLRAPLLGERPQDLVSWQAVLREHRDWALKLQDDATNMSAAAQDRYAEMDVMIKCLDVAVVNIEHSIKKIEPKYVDLKKWVVPAIAENEQLVSNWEHYFALAHRVPISASMIKFMTARDVRHANMATLDALVDAETARRAGRLAPTALKKLNTMMRELESARDAMIEGLKSLFSAFETVTSRSTMSHSEESPALLRDIEAVVKKIDTDEAAALQLSDSARDLAQVAKIGETHVRLMPNLVNRVGEMDGLLQYAAQARNVIAVDSVELMRRVSEITSLHSRVKTLVGTIEHSEEELATFDYLRLIHQLPYMYASYVAEAIRRREWSEKVTVDSSTLANEMALFQDEEAKRRKKWHKTVGNTYGSELESNVMGLEVSVMGENSQWPEVNTRDLEEVLEHLQVQGADISILDDIQKLVGGLSTPTRKQTKRIKAFKNGSVHEAALGRSGLLIRGDDDLVKSLLEDKTKLEDRLKTAESRVRRLEDLLHREQTKLTTDAALRPNIGAILLQSPTNASAHQFFERDSLTGPMSSEVADQLKKASDDNHRLVQQVEQLKELVEAEKRRSTDIEDRFVIQSSENQALKSQTEEALSTKNDLLDNFEGLKQEFIVERKELLVEISTLKTRLEDTEEEIDHFSESREIEKASLDKRVKLLEQEVETLSSEKLNEAAKVDEEFQLHRDEARLQQERILELEDQVKVAQNEKLMAVSALDAAPATAETELRTLRRLHVQLYPGETVPEGVDIVEDALTSRVLRTQALVDSLESNTTLLRTELATSQDSAKGLKIELQQTRDRLAAEEAVAVELRDVLGREQANSSALQHEIEASQLNLRQLQVKVSDEETGSETLRGELEVARSRIAALADNLVSTQSQVDNLEMELGRQREQSAVDGSRTRRMTAMMDSRMERAKDLTQSLYSQTDKLHRLLERLGFSVIREGTAVTIQRVSKTERSGQNTAESSDPGSSVRRSLSLGTHGLGDGSDLKQLWWWTEDEEDPEDKECEDASSAIKAETDRYLAFVTHLGIFDTDLFADTIYRRVRDVEHSARKMQRDARLYRDKAHVAQREAHAKIGFRHFKEGDLALFLPTRNQKSGAWAAFNVGFPHYFLREQDSHRLRTREWLVARISRIQERVVDLSKSTAPAPAPTGGVIAGESDSINDDEHDNPFQLSDGLRWYLIDAHEDKGGAPATPGPGKSTVQGSRVEAVAEAGPGSGTGAGSKLLLSRNSIEGVSKTLSRSLESRRSSAGSARKIVPSFAAAPAALRGSALATESTSASTSPRLQYAVAESPRLISARITPPSDDVGHARPSTSPPTVLGVKSTMMALAGH